MQISSFERGDGGNISRTPDDDIYGCSHIKADVGPVEKTSLATASMFMNLHEQHAIIYDNEFITTEPVKKMNEA